MKLHAIKESIVDFRSKVSKIKLYIIQYYYSETYQKRLEFGMKNA
jgi:hypothetical protein